MGAEPARGKTLLAASLGLLLAVVAPFKSGRQALAQTVGAAPPAEAASALSAGQGATGFAALPPGTWTNYFQEHEREFRGNSIYHGPGLVVLERLLLKTDLRPERFNQPGNMSKRDMIWEALRPMVQKALNELVQAKSLPPTAAGATAKLAALAAAFRDFHAVSDFVSWEQQDAVVIGHHLIETRLLQARESQIADSVEKVRMDWRSSGPADGAEVPAAKGGTVSCRMLSDVGRELSADLDVALKRPRFLNQTLSGALTLSGVLIEHDAILAALESGNAPEAHVHIFKVAQEHGAAGLDQWLKFCGRARRELWLASASILPLLDGVAPVFMGANENERALWRMEDPRASLRFMLRKPDCAYLKMLSVWAFDRLDAVLNWPMVERLLYKGLRAESSHDNLRGALSLMCAKALHKIIPEPLWAAFLRQPPASKDERKSLGEIARMLGGLEATPELDVVLRGHAPDGPSGRLDYAGLKRALLRLLQKNLNETLGLSEKARTRLAQDAGFVHAVSRDDLFGGILALFSFSNEMGRALLKRLLEDLSDSPVENGRIRYARRYEKLKGKIPDDVLTRWMEDYDEGRSSGANEHAGPVADPEAAFGAVKSILAPSRSAGPAIPAPLSEEETFHATDDLAMMIHMGNDPIPTCQRCTEGTNENRSGQPVSRLLLGQIRLGYWLRGNALAARTVLEIGKDDEGNPALFVEKVYSQSKSNVGLDWERMKQSILKYARYLGVASVYFNKANSGPGWLEGPLRKLKLFDQGSMLLYRDGFHEPVGFGVRLFGAARASRSFLGRFLARIFSRPKPLWSYDAGGRLGIELGKRFLAMGNVLSEEGDNKVFELNTPPDQPGWVGRGVRWWERDDIDEEVRSLRRLDRMKIPHARLIAHGNGIVIKEKINGPPLSKLLAKGPLSPRQQASLIDLIYKGVKHGCLIGGAALIWNGEEFLVENPFFVQEAPHDRILDFLLHEIPASATMSRSELWSLLKARAGPESKQWRRLSEGLPGELRDGTVMDAWERGHPEIGEAMAMVRAARADEESGHGR